MIITVDLSYFHLDPANTMTDRWVIQAETHQEMATKLAGLLDRYNEYAKASVVLTYGQIVGYL